MVRNLRYRLLNCEIQDWVQLPTKEEMDLWRKKYRVVTKVIVIPHFKETNKGENKWVLK